MKSNIYYLFLALMALLLMSCGEAPRTEKDSVIEYDVIEIEENWIVKYLTDLKTNNYGIYNSSVY